jgi:hypothetical protein
MDDASLAESESFHGCFALDWGFLGLTVTKDAGRVDALRNKACQTLDPDLQQGLTTEHNALWLNGKADTDRPRVVCGKELELVELRGDSVEDRLEDGVRLEFLAYDFRTDVGNAMVRESEGKYGLGILVVVDGEGNPAAPACNLLIAELPEVAQVDTVACRLLLCTGRESGGGYGNDFLSAQRLAPADEFLDPFDILSPLGQAALDEREFPVLSYCDVDLAQLVGVVRVGNVIVPFHILMGADEQFVYPVDLSFECFRCLHKLPAKLVPGPDAAQRLHAADRHPGTRHCSRLLSLTG